MENKEQLLDLSTQIGQFIEYWGFKEIHGKVWTLIFLSPTPVNATYIYKTLGVSKSLISISIKELLDYDVIQQEFESTVHRQLYKINPNVKEVIFKILNRRESKMLLQIKTSQEILSRQLNNTSGSSQLCETKVEKLGEMIDMANGLLKAFISLNSVDFKIFEKFMKFKGA